MRIRRLALTTGLGYLTVLAACSAPEQPGAELRDRVDDREAPASFSMRYEATGTRVLDCFVPNREFTIEVRDDTLLTRSGEDPTTVLAQRASTQLDLAPALFEPEPLEQSWLTIDLSDLPSPDRATVAELLGADLASYLLADGRPPHGQEIALAALETAAAVEMLGTESIDGRAAERYRITLDPERYARSIASSTAPAADEETPTVDVWVDERNDVVRVAVASDATSPAETRGWVIDFKALEAGGLPEIPSKLPADSLDLRTLSAAPGDCEL